MIATLRPVCFGGLTLALLTACGSSDGPGAANANANGGASPGGASSDGGSSNGGASPGGASSNGGSSSGGASSGGATSSGGASSGGAAASGGASSSGGAPGTNPADGPPAGYADGHATIPAEAQAEDVSSPTTVIGTGTPASCTGDAFVKAVAAGGVITFDCGPDPVTILTQTAKVFNDKGTKLVIDGGNKVTLSGGGTSRILYMATCDKAQVYPPGPGDCNTNPGVQLVVQNITFVDGSAKGIAEGTNNSAGGGAIHAQGGSLKVVNSRFFNNVCDDLGSDLGGGAIRKLDYLVATGAGPARPAWVVNSTFGGKDGFGNSCANGGALSSIGVSWNILNSVLSNNKAVGHGANSGNGGNGGAIYNDGNEIVLNVTASLVENNVANEGGSAIFFVSNNKSGSITITDSLFQNNPRGTFETFFGVYVIAKAPAQIVNSQILR